MFLNKSKKSQKRIVLIPNINFSMYLISMLRRTTLVMEKIDEYTK